MIKNRSAQAQRENAEAIAIGALQFLAGDTEHMERFLSLSGLAPDGLRAAAAEPGFLAAVLEFLAQDESLLFAFAAHSGLSPEAVDKARLCLNPPFERDFA